MIIITLTDSTDTFSFDYVSPPLTEGFIEGSTDLIRLDNNVTTYFTVPKQSWALTYAFMDSSVYTRVRGFHRRQFSTGDRPYLTISGEVTMLPVKMELSDRQIIDNCLTVSDVSLNFRESVQSV